MTRQIEIFTPLAGPAKKSPELSRKAEVHARVAAIRLAAKASAAKPDPIVAGYFKLSSNAKERIQYVAKHGTHLFAAMRAGKLVQPKN